MELLRDEVERKKKDLEKQCERKWRSMPLPDRMEIQVWQKRANDKERLLRQKLEERRAVKRKNLIGQREKRRRLSDDTIEKIYTVLTGVASYNSAVEKTREGIQEEELSQQRGERFEEIMQNEVEKQQGETEQESEEFTQTREEGVNKNVAFVSENVVNLLERILTSFELSVLSRGLNFCPAPKKINRSELIKDIREFGPIFIRRASRRILI